MSAMHTRTIISASSVIWVLLIAMDLTASFASAKKEKSTWNSYGDLVERRHSCEICRTLVREAYPIAQELHRNATKRGFPAREEEVLSKVTEVVCNPYVKGGQWLRLIEIVVEDNEQWTSLRPLDYYSQCRRDCTTLANSCNTILDGDYGDALPGLLLKQKLTVDNIDAEVCKPVCLETKSSRSKKLSAKTLKAIAAETPMEIDKKNLDIEEVMDDMERARGGYGGAPKMDVYSRDEMLNVQDAILAGDADRLRELDPMAEDLSDEELEYLRRMYAGEEEPPEGF